MVHTNPSGQIRRAVSHMRKIVLLTAAVLLAAVAFAVPASAQYGDSPSPGVSNPSPTVGSDLTVSGSGCGAGSTVTISLDGEVVATTVADDDGNFSVDIQVPDEPGNYVLSIGCEASGLAAGSLNVVGSGELAGGELAGGSIPACGGFDGGSGSNANTSCVLTVVAAGVTPAGTLPRTGDDSLPLAGIGVVLVALGGLAVLVTRKRSAATA